MDKYERLLDFLTRLERAGIFFKLGRVWDEAVMVEIAVPGQRWEVEFMDDGTIEVERFFKTGAIEGEEALEELFRDFSYGEPTS